MRGAHSVGNDRSAKPTLSWIIPPIQRIGAKGAVIRRWRDVALLNRKDDADPCGRTVSSFSQDRHRGHHAFHAPAHQSRRWP